MPAPTRPTAAQIRGELAEAQRKAARDMCAKTLAETERKNDALISELANRIHAAWPTENLTTLLPGGSNRTAFVQMVETFLKEPVGLARKDTSMGLFCEAAINRVKQMRENNSAPQLSQ